MLMMLDVCLSGLLGTCLSLKRVVFFWDILFHILVHFMLDLIMPLVGVTFVVLLTIILIHVLIIYALFNLTLHPQGQY